MMTQETSGGPRAPGAMPPCPPTIRIPPERRPRRGAVIVTAVLVSAATAIVTLLVMRSPMIPQPIQAAFGGGVEVPSLVGTSFEQGRALLDRKGLVAITEREREDTRVAEGTILAQSPAAGWYAKRGVDVKLTVARGPLTLKVPDVAGLPILQATERVASTKLQLGGPLEAPSASVPAGLAVGTMPPAGAEVAPGMLVHLVVASGPPIVELALPKVTGVSRWQALAVLAKAGLIVDSVKWVDSEDLDAGIVARQDPAASTRVAPGSRVTLWVVRGDD